MNLAVALVQLDAREDVTANIAAAVALAEEAAAGGARLVALPEYLQFRGTDDGFRASARPIPGPHTEPFAEVARRHDAWILIGSTAETSADPDRPYNTSALIAPDGSLAATYRKIHLFDVAVDQARRTPNRRGSRPATGSSAPMSTASAVGLSICYDLRFPELYRSLALAGASILTVPAAFTSAPAATTGRSCCGHAPSRTQRTCSRHRRSADRRASPPTAARWSSTRGARSSPRHPTSSGSSGRTSTSTGSPRSAARSRCWRTAGRPPTARAPDPPRLLGEPQVVEVAAGRRWRRHPTRHVRVPADGVRHRPHEATVDLVDGRLAVARDHERGDRDDAIVEVVAVAAGVAAVGVAPGRRRSPRRSGSARPARCPPIAGDTPGPTTSWSSPGSPGNCDGQREGRVVRGAQARGERARRCCCRPTRPSRSCPARSNRSSARRSSPRYGRHGDHRDRQQLAGRCSSRLAGDRGRGRVRRSTRSGRSTPSR